MMLGQYLRTKAKSLLFIFVPHTDKLVSVGETRKKSFTKEAENDKKPVTMTEVNLSSTKVTCCFQKCLDWFNVGVSVAKSQV